VKHLIELLYVIVVKIESPDFFSQAIVGFCGSFPGFVKVVSELLFLGGRFDGTVLDDWHG